MNCPWCLDTRQRLYINHQWGEPDPVTGGKKLHLAHCFNEGCVDSYPRQKALYDRV